MTNQSYPDYKIILFDGVCNFCNYWVNFVLTRDKNIRFKFAALQSEKGKEILQKFNPPANSFDSFILIENNLIYKKSEAVFKITKDLNGWLKIFFFLNFLPNSVSDFFYDLIAKNRYRLFGKRNSRRIPTEDEKGRFL